MELASVAVLVESADNGSRHIDMLASEVALAWAEELVLEQVVGADGKAGALSEVLLDVAPLEVLQVL